MAFAYHRGERRVQAHAGVLEAADRSAGGVAAEIPPVAAEFLAEQVMVFAGHRHRSGEVWASVLAGPAGFAIAEDADKVRIEARPHPDDPLSESLTAAELQLGMLAIEPQAKRRMRFNGRAALVDERIVLATEQVYANCPKYINVRRPAEGVSLGGAGSASSVRTTVFDDRLRDWVTNADTFFIATTDPEAGADVSHRGGHPGFVEVGGATRLTWPDYRGNSMFMTLGNLELDPRAGLLFPDWESGDVLQLTGTAVIDWAAERASRYPGAERLVDFTLQRAMVLPGALGRRWRLEQLSRFSPPARRPT